MPGLGFAALKARALAGQMRMVGIIVKWSIVAAIFLGFLIFLLGGYLHLQSRLKKGLPPLGYHRVRAALPYIFHGWKTDTGRSSAGRPDATGAHYMNNVAPPPVYDPARLSVYSGHADGGSKVDYAQEPTRRTAEANAAPEYDAPLGPPPPAATR
ncbi:hypothetical protein V8C37DRAFT_413614 [Trichoderma ceciliae]